MLNLLFLDIIPSESELTADPCFSETDYTPAPIGSDFSFKKTFRTIECENSVCFVSFLSIELHSHAYIFGLLIDENLSGCYVCPLDDVLGIRKYDRIGDNISAELVMEAAETSHAEVHRL